MVGILIICIGATLTFRLQFARFQFHLLDFNFHLTRDAGPETTRLLGRAWVLHRRSNFHQPKSEILFFLGYARA